MRARKFGLAFLGLAAALGLSACTAPMQTGYGPPVTALPPKPASLDAYAWLDRSDALLDAIADAPPDYSFDHAGRQLFAWEVDGVLIVEEAGPDGYVLYLFDAGQSLPFLVRTPDFAAGFDRGELAAFYTREGRVYSGTYSSANHADAHALRERGGGILEAARRSRWDRDAARAWAGVQSFIIETRSAWDDRWRADRELAEYRRRSEAEAMRAALADERRRRREARDDFRRWRDRGAAGAPPPGMRRDRDGLADRRRERDERPGDGATRPDDRPSRPDRARDREARPAPLAPADTGRQLEAPVNDTEPEYRRTPPGRAPQERPPVVEAPPPQDSSATISAQELLRSEEERDRRAAENLARAQREQEEMARARREAEAAEGRRQDERRRMQAVEEAQSLAAEAERARQQAASAEAERRAAEQQAAAEEAQRRLAEAEAEAARARQAEAAAADEEAQRRRRADEAEAARRQAEQEAADERARATQRRRLEESTLEPQ